MNCVMVKVADSKLSWRLIARFVNNRGLQFFDTPNRQMVALGKRFIRLSNPQINIPKPEIGAGTEGIWKNYRYVDGLAGNRVLAIMEDKAGAIWFATDGGLSRFDGKNWKTYTQKDGLANNDVRAIIQDKEGVIWFGTWGGGLSRFDGKCFQTIDSRDGLANDSVHSVYLDRSGNVWLGTEGGVVQFTPNKIPPAVYITQLTADKTHENPKEKIKLSSNISRLYLNYHAISFKTRPGGMKYFYQLVGQDQDWQGPTNSETVEYFNLNPGDYTFKVQAVDRDLNYSELASFQLTISPLWHQVGWVRGILAAGSLTFVLTFGWVSWRLAVNRIAKRKLEKELQAREAREAQLQILRYQLNPHFLFNVLNSIRALVNEDHNIARKMIATLSEYLRYSLLNTDSLEVKFKDEIESIRQYLSLEKVRFENKLEVEIQIDKAAEETRVPVFLLQPLVENAIKYGMRTSEKPLKIRVGTRMSARNGRLQLEVSNTGRWIEPSVESEERDKDDKDKEYQNVGIGIGLKNVRNRLDHTFPDRHSFEIFERDGWVCAVIAISY